MSNYDTITPELLRASFTSKWVRFPGEYAPMFADALELADDHACCMITSYCSWSGDDPNRWYDTENCDDGSENDIKQAVRYLTMRGLIEQKGALVHIKEARPQ